MAVAGDCDGTPACEADTESGHFLTGDSATGTYAFTACDLKRDHTKGHSVDVPTDTYQGCVPLLAARRTRDTALVEH